MAFELESFRLIDFTLWTIPPDLNAELPDMSGGLTNVHGWRRRNNLKTWPDHHHGDMHQKVIYAIKATLTLNIRQVPNFSHITFLEFLRSFALALGIRSCVHVNIHVGYDDRKTTITRNKAEKTVAYMITSFIFPIIKLAKEADRFVSHQSRGNNICVMRT
mmetsp:Transcript_23230/g.39348  ORF Transcript_23230/g.39348 Transcript_23230/m.39348 type:complete len:161 (+) Transcript_23230:415-897(+)